MEIDIYTIDDGFDPYALQPTGGESTWLAGACGTLEP